MEIITEGLLQSMENLVAAVVGLLGVTAGALLQYWLSRRTMLESRQTEQVSIAYADYLLGVAGVAQAQRHKDNTGLRESLRQLTDAKTRIAVYGDSQVIATMAAFERLGPVLATPEQRKAFVSIINAMRRNRGNHSALISDQDILQVIFGAES